MSTAVITITDLDDQTARVVLTVEGSVLSRGAQLAYGLCKQAADDRAVRGHFEFHSGPTNSIDAGGMRTDLRERLEP